MRVRIMTWLPALAGFFALTLVADEAAAQCGHRPAANRRPRPRRRHPLRRPAAKVRLRLRVAAAAAI
jgi:hypothetical protein